MTKGEAEQWLGKARRAGFEKSPHRKWMVRLLDRIVGGEALALTTERMLKQGLINTLENGVSEEPK